MGYLQMCCCQYWTIMLVVLFVLDSFLNRFVKTFKNVLRIDKSNDTVKVDGTTKPFVDPEKWRKVAWICQSCRLKEDVVKRTLFVHQRLYCSDSCVPFRCQQELAT